MVHTPLPPPQTSSWLNGSIKFKIFKSQSKSIPIEIHSFSKSILRLDIIDSKSSLFYNENMTPPIANNVLSALPSVTLVTFLISMVEVYQKFNWTIWSGQKWVIFTLFLFFFLSCPKACKSAKKNFFSICGGEYHLPESHNFGPNWGKTLKFL